MAPETNSGDLSWGKSKHVIRVWFSYLCTVVTFKSLLSYLFIPFPLRVVKEQNEEWKHFLYCHRPPVHSYNGVCEDTNRSRTSVRVWIIRDSEHIHIEVSEIWTQNRWREKLQCCMCPQGDVVFSYWTSVTCHLSLNLQWQRQRLEHRRGRRNGCVLLIFLLCFRGKCDEHRYIPFKQLVITGIWLISFYFFYCCPWTAGGSIA